MLPSLSVSSTPLCARHSADTPHSASHTGVQGQASAAQAVNSQDLLQGHKTVAIAHNGAIYHLQATRLGKLILTK